MPRSELNQQVYGYNCGFHVVLAAESHLMNQATRLRNLNLAVERTRLIGLLRGLLDGNIPAYVARPINGPLLKDDPVALRTLSNTQHVLQPAISMNRCWLQKPIDRESPHVTDIPWEYQPHPEAAYQVPTVANFDEYDCDVRNKPVGSVDHEPSLLNLSHN
uniref:Uncharacterized protein n=1 Tax=Ditylenchus dipsaci TaxID=166011 RepID=A0A915DZ21_9BILA